MAPFDHIFIVSYLFLADLYIIYLIFCVSASHKNIATCGVTVGFGQRFGEHIQEK
jgi:hypothetical protein